MQASAQVVESQHVPTAGAAPVGAASAGAGDEAGGADAGAAADARQPGRRLPRGLIELAGLVLGIGFVAAVALNHTLSNDEFWQLAAGQWMLAHHSIIGLDPFSYTETHRRWVTDEWASEVVLAQLFRWFGSAAYEIYAVTLGGLCLVVSATYARVLGARGGRVVAIVLLLALGLAGQVVGDRGLDFSLVWFPLELLVLAKARHEPRWLLLLPPLCLVWVNTHGSVLLGLAVLAAELAWALAPRRLVTRLGGVARSPHRRWLAVTLTGSVLAACVTPYGPGLLAYDIGVTRDGQISKYIAEWNSPNFHSFMALLVFLVPLAVLVACVWNRRIPVLEGTLSAVLFIEALRTQRLVDYLMLVTVGLAATLPARPAWGATARRWAGGAMMVLAVVILAAPSVPAGTVAPNLPVQAFDWLQPHPGRVFTEYTWGDYSIARGRATFVDGRTDLFVGRVLTEFFDITDLKINPDPVLSAYHVDYVVWTPRSSLGIYLSHDPRWRVVDRTRVALVFARRRVVGVRGHAAPGVTTQAGDVASIPRTSPS